MTETELHTFVVNNLDAPARWAGPSPGFLCGHTSTCFILGFKNSSTGWQVISYEDTILSFYSSYRYKRSTEDRILKSD